MKEGETGKSARKCMEWEQKAKRRVAGTEKMKMLEDGLRKEGGDMESDRREELITKDSAKEELE